MAVERSAGIKTSGIEGGGAVASATSLTLFPGSIDILYSIQLEYKKIIMFKFN